MEKDDQIKGEGNSINYIARMQDTRIGRFLSVDPLTKSFPHYSPYQFAGNTPIQAIDLDGAEELQYTQINQNNGTATLTVTKIYNVVTAGPCAVTDVAFISSQVPNIAPVYSPEIIRYVKVLPSRNNELRTAGFLEKTFFSISNLFKSRAEKEANYRQQYTDLTINFNFQVNITPNFTLIDARTAVANNQDLMGTIYELPLRAGVPGNSFQKVSNTSTNSDDEVRLSSSFYGANGTDRNLMGANGMGNGGQLIGHEIGHNILGDTHPNTDGTAESYPSRGMGANTSNVSPSQKEVKEIVNKSRHTLPN